MRQPKKSGRTCERSGGERDALKVVDEFLGGRSDALHALGLVLNFLCVHAGLLAGSGSEDLDRDDVVAERLAVPRGNVLEHGDGVGVATPREVVEAVAPALVLADVASFRVGAGDRVGLVAVARVAAQTETERGKETAETYKARGGATCDTKDTCDAEGDVERGTAADDVGEDAPGGRAEDETAVEGEGHPADVALDVEFTLYLREDDGDALEPEVVGHPAPTGEEEELPLDLAHADVRDLLLELVTIGGLDVLVGSVALGDGLVADLDRFDGESGSSWTSVERGEGGGMVGMDRGRK
ncbi:hypothetical protein L1887_58837 [Cichorium endivia]|nr:hypothetical protein L1887_58837 [Cichorium endivia]